VLFVLVALQQTGTVLPIATSAPWLIGVPLTELMLLWHQRRVADGRARLTDPESFPHRLPVTGRVRDPAQLIPVRWQVSPGPVSLNT
jgi:hypothetical protein